MKSEDLGIEKIEDAEKVEKIGEAEVQAMEAEFSEKTAVDPNAPVDEKPFELPHPVEDREMTDAERLAEEDRVKNSVYGTLLEMMANMGFKDDTINFFLNSKYFYFAKDLPDENQMQGFALFLNRMFVLRDGARISTWTLDREAAIKAGQPEPVAPVTTHTRIIMNLVMHQIPDDWLAAMATSVLPYLKEYEDEYFVNITHEELTQIADTVTPAEAQ